MVEVRVLVLGTAHNSTGAAALDSTGAATLDELFGQLSQGMVHFWSDAPLQS